MQYFVLRIAWCNLSAKSLAYVDGGGGGGGGSINYGTIFRPSVVT